MSVATHRLPRRLPLAFIVGAIFGTFESTVCHATTVSDCTDGSGAGTLRNLIASATEGSTVEIPMACSRITLTHGAILVSSHINDIYIVGQGHAATVIDGDPKSTPPFYDRVLLAQNDGTLELNGLTITGGQNPDGDRPQGGCIYARGDVGIVDSVVTGCKIPLGGYGTVNAKGAGIYAKKTVTLVSSQVTNNTVLAEQSASALGGGIYAKGTITLINTTISGNSALKAIGAGSSSSGGGIFSAGKGNLVVQNSTISNNSAGTGGAVAMAKSVQASYTASFTSSTISGNASTEFRNVNIYWPVTVINSTIAFNRAADGGDDFPVGLYSSDTITMQSSIFANNTSENGEANDVQSTAASNPITGANDLITATTGVVPFGTISNCPLLGHLSSNGGLTQTIPLRAGSPALNVGAANGATTDQRGTGFPRSVGSGTDIGAYERQTGVVDDVVFYSEFESRCN